MISFHVKPVYVMVFWKEADQNANSIGLPTSEVIALIYVLFDNRNAICVRYTLSKMVVVDGLMPARFQGPLLLTWFNFNPSMDK